MQTKITIRNEAQTCYIDIEGVIGVSEQTQFESADSRISTYESFRQEVERITRVAATSVVVNIRSTGGDVNDALLIYEALQGLDAHITTRCYGYTASAATIIAQAANKGCREISSNALYLIHNSTCSIEGNAASLDARAELLRKTDERLAWLYAQHSGEPVEKFEALMAENGGEGRWLSAEETLSMGLADKIIDSLIVGSLVPESSGEDEIQQSSTSDAEPQAQAKDKPSQNKEQSAAQLPQDLSKKDLAKAIDSAASALVRFLMRRFSYRWEKWVDGWREKREQKVATKVGGHKALGSQSDAEITTPEPESKSESKPKSVDVPQAAVSKSIVAFEEGQRRYVKSQVKAVEDPSMSGPHSASNELAYADDARAFGRY